MGSQVTDVIVSGSERTRLILENISMSIDLVELNAKRVVYEQCRAGREGVDSDKIISSLEKKIQEEKNDIFKFIGMLSDCPPELAQDVEYDSVNSVPNSDTRTRIKQESESYVYILYDELYQLVKVGKANSPYVRLNHLTKKYNNGLSLVNAFWFINEHEALSFESSAHSLLSENRVRHESHMEGSTEFFDIDIDECHQHIINLYSEWYV